MYKIKYYNIEVKENKINNETNEYENTKELKELEYKTRDEEFEYWLDLIQKSYGRYGEVTSKYVEDELTKDELTIKTINTLTIENKKKDVLIASLTEQINNLNIKLNQIGGSENV